MAEDAPQAVTSGTQLATGQIGDSQPAPAPTPGEAPPLAEAPRGTPSTPQPDPWFNSIQNEDLRGLAESRHWESPEQLLQSYKELESLKGIPPEQLLRVPKDINNSEEMAAIFAKLGRPEEASGYGIEGDEAWVGDLFLEAGLNPHQAKLLNDGWDEHQQQQILNSDEAFSQQAQLDVDTLRREWGDSFDDQMRAVQGFVKAEGLNEDAMLALERNMGTKSMLKMFAKYGGNMMEANAPDGSPPVSAEGKDGMGRMTPQAAKAAWETLTRDPDHRAKILSEDPKVRETALAAQRRLSQLAFD